MYETQTDSVSLRERNSQIRVMKNQLLVDLRKQNAEEIRSNQKKIDGKKQQ